MTLSRAEMLRVLRRTHMYAGLILFPVVAVYGVSGYVFNHPTNESGTDLRTSERNTLQRTTLGYGPRLLPTQRVADLTTTVTRAMNTAAGASSTVPRYRLVNPDVADLNAQLLFQMESGDTTWSGAYNPGVNGLVQAIRQTAPTWWLPLSRVHVTAGYPQANASATSDMRTTRIAWAIVVDGVAILLVYWGLSGLLMWWQNRSQRRIGLVCNTLCLVVVVSIIGPVYASAFERRPPLTLTGPPDTTQLPSSSVTPIVPHADRLGALMQVHIERLHRSWVIFDTPNMRREAEACLTLYASLPRAARPVWEDTASTAFYALLTLTMFDHPGDLAATLARGRALGLPIATFFSSGNPIVKVWLGDVGKPTPVLEGKYQYPMAGVRRPTLGNVSLFMQPNDLPDTVVRRWVRRYGQMGLDVTLVLSLTGKTPTGQSAVPEREAEADRQFYLDFLQWPGALVIQEPLTMTDGVRHFGTTPYEDTYRWSPVLTDRAGRRVFVTGSINRPDAQQLAEIEAAIKRALTASRHSATITGEPNGIDRRRAGVKKV